MITGLGSLSCIYSIALSGVNLIYMHHPMGTTGFQYSSDLMGAQGQFIASPVIYFAQGLLHSLISTRYFESSMVSSLEMGKNKFITDFFPEENGVKGI